VTNQEVKVLVTLVHASGMENLAENWVKELKKESQGMDTVRKVEELEMLSKVKVEKVVETSGVLVIFAPQNSLGCILHSQLARVYAARYSFLLDDDILVTSDADVFPLHPRVLYPLHRAHIAWVYSYGLSLAKSFTFAMTLVGLRVREWKKVIKDATKGFEFETIGEEKREEDMVADVAWLERRLSLRSAEEK